VRRPDRPTLRAAWWTFISVCRARRRLRREGLDDFVLASPPPLPAEAERGVHAVLRRVPQTCLERALVLQRWKASHGDPLDVVIAVRGPASEFSAHAWLDGEPEARNGHEELLRIPPP
jgi:hypothetical protein